KPSEQKQTCLGFAMARKRNFLRTFSLSHPSKSKLAWVCHGEKTQLLRTFSLSHPSKNKLAWVLPWRENATF
ncbi:MAG: hypothetical protein SOW56_04160, partial [Bacteroidaceae bacterium]|nr:hypothetical protein [Bacteroidaceae bacterium]